MNRKKFSVETWFDGLFAWFWDTLSGAFLIGGGLILLSLISFSPDDPSLFVGQNPLPAVWHNFCGRLGAQLSSWIFNAYGLGLVPLLGGLWVAVFYVRLRSPVWSLGRWLFFFPQFCFFYWIFLGGLGENIFFNRYPFPLGGEYGPRLFQSVEQYLGKIGTWVLSILGLLVIGGSLWGRRWPRFYWHSTEKDLVRHEKKERRSILEGPLEKFFQIFPPRKKHVDSDQEVLREKIQQIISPIMDNYAFGTQTSCYLGPYFFEVSVSVSLNDDRQIQNLKDDLSIKFKTPTVFDYRDHGELYPRFVVMRTPPFHIFWYEGFGSFYRRSFPGHVPAFLGLKVRGEPCGVDLGDFPHILIAGSPGMGKSNMIHSLLLSLLLRFSPQELRLGIFDAKKTEFSLYSQLSHVDRLMSKPEEMSIYLNEIYHQIDKRLDILKNFGKRSILSYWQQCGALPFPLHIIVIDDLSELLVGAQKLINLKLIQTIAQKGRAVGIHLILSVQKSFSEFVPGSLKVNIPVRIALGLKSFHDSRTILDVSGAEKLHRPGDALMWVSGGSEPLLFNTLWMDDHFLEKSIFLIQNHYLMKVS